MTGALERWDVVVKVLNGPLQSSGEQVHRGPIVRIGANPGPGGVQLTGYRGLDARQCTITAYAGGTAAVSPVGTNQVRLAPHANVNWKDIDPINGPEYLSDGCALHIGPVGRGATLEFVECRRLGVWQAGEIRSDVGEGAHASSAMGRQMAGGRGYGAGVGAGGIPQAYDARRVGKVRTSSVPYWFMGCLTLILTVTGVTLITIPTAWIYLQRDVASLGPVDDSRDYFQSVDIVKNPPSQELLEGLHQPMYEFVMAINAERAGENQRGLDDPAVWDQRFLRYLTKSVEEHVRQRRVFKNLDSKRVEYATVLKELRKAGLPEVFAAIPYQESRYDGSMQSKVCAKGFWQFMPETALRVERLGGQDFRVRNCRFRGRPDLSWDPTALAPPFTRNAEYVEDDQCLIVSCAIDDRTDLVKSTDAAIYELSKAWNDPDIMASGSAVQATILSHNSGYNDAPYGMPKENSNILPVLKKWHAKNGLERGPHFYGDNILCADHTQQGRCGGLLMAETQHYAYNIIAQHFLAVCYYSKEYAEDPAFAPWQAWALDESYCRNFKIPSKSEVRSW